MVTITKRATGFANHGVIEVTFASSSTPPPTNAFLVSYPNFGGPNTRGQVFWNSYIGNTGGTPKSSAQKRDVWTTFKGITIPMGAVITSAILTIISQKFSGTQFIMQANVWDSNDAFFNNPSTYPSAATIYSRFMAHTRVGGGNAPPLMQTTPTGTKREKVVFTRPNASVSPPGGWPNVNTHDLDVTNMVQRLVNQWAYSNQAMTFQLAGDFPNTNITGTDLYAAIYTEWMHTGTFSPKVTTATSLGTSIYTPKLVIEFSTAVETDSEFDADAVLTIDSYLRSCIEVDAILGEPGPSHEGFEVAAAILAYLNANGDSTGFVLLDSVINPTTGRVYTNHAIKSSIGYLESTNQITGNPFVPPPSETGAYNFKKTTWSIV